MKRIIGDVALLALVAFVFWPWALAIVEFVRWFLHMAPLHAWDPDRIAFAIFWPVGAALVALFLLWVFSGWLEWF